MCNKTTSRSQNSSLNNAICINYCTLRQFNMTTLSLRLVYGIGLVFPKVTPLATSHRLTNNDNWTGPNYLKLIAKLFNSYHETMKNLVAWICCGEISVLFHTWLVTEINTGSWSIQICDLHARYMAHKIDNSYTLALFNILCNRK